MGYGVIQCLSKDPSIKRSGFSSPYSFHSFLVASKTRRYLKMVFLGQNGPCLNHPSLHFVLNFEDELITKRRFGADRIRVEYVSKPNPVELALIDPKWEYCRSQLKAPFFATMTTNQRPRNCDTSNRRVPFFKPITDCISESGPDWFAKNEPWTNSPALLSMRYISKMIGQSLKRPIWLYSIYM